MDSRQKQPRSQVVLKLESKKVNPDNVFSKRSNLTEKHKSSSNKEPSSKVTAVKREPLSPEPSDVKSAKSKKRPTEEEKVEKVSENSRAHVEASDSSSAGKDFSNTKHFHHKEKSPSRKHKKSHDSKPAKHTSNRKSSRSPSPISKKRVKNEPTSQDPSPTEATKGRSNEINSHKKRKSENESSKANDARNKDQSPPMTKKRQATKEDSRDTSRKRGVSRERSNSHRRDVSKSSSSPTTARRNRHSPSKAQDRKVRKEDESGRNEERKKTSTDVGTHAKNIKRPSPTEERGGEKRKPHGNLRGRDDKDKLRSSSEFSAKNVPSSTNRHPATSSDGRRQSHQQRQSASDMPSKKGSERRSRSRETTETRHRESDKSRHHVRHSSTKRRSSVTGETVSTKEHPTTTERNEMPQPETVNSPSSSREATPKALEAVEPVAEGQDKHRILDTLLSQCEDISDVAIDEYISLQEEEEEIDEPPTGADVSVAEESSSMQLSEKLAAEVDKLATSEELECPETASWDLEEHQLFLREAVSCTELPSGLLSNSLSTSAVSVAGQEEDRKDKATSEDTGADEELCSEKQVMKSRWAHCDVLKALDVPWHELVHMSQRLASQQKVDLEQGTVPVHALVQHCGGVVSQRFAGPQLYQKAKEVLGEETTRHWKENLPACLQLNVISRIRRRAALMTDYGDYSIALSARKDLEIRNFLNNCMPVD